jgi:AcrR family transcriptional regulator
VSKRKRRRSTELRRDILSAAQQVFTEKGYAAASTREIAERANAAEPLIFRHFEKKATLFAAAVFETIERTLDEYLGESNIFYQENVSPIDGMRDYVELIVGTIRSNRRLFIAYLNAITFHRDEFSHLRGNSAPPSFHARLVHLERISVQRQGKSKVVIRDRHFEVRLILLFLCSVALFDDLFFDPTEQDDERESRSIIKLLTWGIGVKDAEPANSGSTAPLGIDAAKLRALEDENQKLRTLLTNAMLELHSVNEARARTERP